MKTFALLVISVLFIVASMSIATSDSEKVEIPKYSTKVRLGISAREEIKNEVYSYLSRELRSLGDVKLIENDPNWTWSIQVVAMQVKNRAGYDIAVAFSVVIEKRYNVVELLLLAVQHVFQISSEEWDELKKTKRMIDLEKAFTMLSGSQSDIRGHWLRVGDTEDVQRLCKMIVADFDAEHLKKDRETWQELWEDLFRRYPPKDDSSKENNSNPNTD